MTNILATNNIVINEVAAAADLLTARAANLATMIALTDAWNSLTDEQKADFTENVGGFEAVTVAISMGGNSARLVDDEWHEKIGENNPAADAYIRHLEAALNNIDTDALYRGELWDGANPENKESYRPLRYTSGDIQQASNMYKIAREHLANLLAAIN